MKNKLLLILILLSLALPQLITAKEPPTNEDVIEALNSLISKEKEAKQKKEQETPGFLEVIYKMLSKIIRFILQILSFIINLFILFRHFIFILIIGIFLFLIFMIFKDSIPLFKGTVEGRQKKEPKKETVTINLSFQELYKLALDAAKKGNFNQAVIYLQKSSIELLKATIITNRVKKYTNNDIKRMIVNAPLYQPFCKITLSAEKARFSSYDIDNSEYQRVLTAFENSFMEQK